jgi:hypothetical protein
VSGILFIAFSLIFVFTSSSEASTPVRVWETIEVNERFYTGNSYTEDEFNKWGSVPGVFN